MSSATFIKFRVNNAEQFKESVSEPKPNTNLYLTYGKIDAWANDSSPGVANSSVATEYEIWSNMIAGKKILGNDISHVIRRFNWTSDSKYIAYDHRNSNLYDGNTQFYVITSDYNVYKCLANNNGANSTAEPTAINTSTPTETSDGYIWKYMYTVSDSELLRFTTTNYMPVKTIPANEGSLQWNVQENATEGAIYSIFVANGGMRYTNTSNIVVLVSGDGSSATATATINATTQTVTAKTMTDYGHGDTFASLSSSAGAGTGAQGTAIISPPGGHGSNPIYELGGSNLMINPVIRGTEGDILPATNDIRQISILKDPLKRDGQNVSSNLIYMQALTLTTVGSGDYQQDEIVYQGPSVSSSVFSARVVSWDSANGIAVVINTVGTPTTQSLIGATTTTSRFVSNIVQNELKPYTGQILYINNLMPIVRSSDQAEDYRIVLKF
jgi:hypothetical protein